MTDKDQLVEAAIGAMACRIKYNLGCSDLMARNGAAAAFHMLHGIVRVVPITATDEMRDALEDALDERRGTKAAIDAANITGDLTRPNG